jgi:hypothetical protein
MARLSREMRGLILPHDDYGSHLDEKDTPWAQNWKKRILVLLGRLWMKFVQVNS